MNKKIKHELKLSEELTIEVSGNYYSGCMATMEQPEEYPEFDLDNIQIVKGNICELLWFIEDNEIAKVFDYISDKTIESLNNQE